MHFPMNTHTSINLALVENVRTTADGKITARCPACAEEGRDATGNHLCLLTNGVFTCIIHPGDEGAEHRKRIFALAGIRGSGFPFRDAEETVRRHREQFLRSVASTSALSAIGRYLPVLEKEYAWASEAVSEDSPQDVSGNIAHDPWWFLRSLFKDEDLLWTGDVWQTGKPWHATRWCTCENIASLLPHEVGPYTTPATWKELSVSRSDANVLTAPYVVLDFDEFNGKKPETPEEIEALKTRALAVINWLRKARGWKLAAILDTGHKSLHAWFHCPSREILDSLKVVHKPLGLDDRLLGHPAQPCRLPGHPHPKSGNLSKVLWLQSSSG
jgi:hypothetical protein